MVQEFQQYGVSVMTLSDLVSNLCIEQGNDKRTVYLKTLKHAEWAWKDLFRTTMWSVKTVVLEVHDKKHTIQLPTDCDRLINISVKDHHNRLHPLTSNTDINTSEIRCIKHKCSCKKCKGEDSLCAALDSITRTTQTVVIKGTNYTMTTWVRHDGSGNIQQVSEVPTWDVSTGTVIMTKQESLLCNVEVDEKGCIKATKPNMEVLNNFCGWNGAMFWDGIGGAYNGLIPAPYNYWGHYNVNTASPSIVHIFHGHHLRHNVPGWPTQEVEPDKDRDERHWGEIRSVIVTYQTNGETEGSEILVPEYAYDAVTSGIMYRQHKFNPRDGDPSGTYYNHFRRDKMNVMKYLNPVRMEDIEKLQTNLRRW